MSNIKFGNERERNTIFVCVTYVNRFVFKSILAYIAPHPPIETDILLNRQTDTHTIIYIILYKGTAILLLLLLLCCRSLLSLKLKQSQLTSCWYVGGWGEGGRVRSEPTTTMTELHCTPTSRHVTSPTRSLHCTPTSRHVTSPTRLVNVCSHRARTTAVAQQ